MRVIVRFHRTVEDDLNRWIAGTDDSNDEADRALIRLYCEEMKRILIETRGKPPGATRPDTARPDFYRWRYAGDLEIDYVIQAKPGPFYMPQTIRIVITELRTGRAG